MCVCVYVCQCSNNSINYNIYIYIYIQMESLTDRVLLEAFKQRSNTCDWSHYACHRPLYDSASVPLVLL